MFWNEETARRVAALEAAKPVPTNVALSILTAEQAKKDPSQWDLDETFKYDRAANARQEEWNNSMFSASFDQLVNPRRLIV